MNRIITGFVFLCAFAGACVPAMAQVTLTASDIDAQLAVGNSIITVSDTLTTSVNIGSPGSTSWDFSGLLNHTSTTMTSVTPSTTPFISQFPGTTNALKTSLAGSFSGIPGTVAGDLYTYVARGTNLVNLGSMGSGTITLPGANPLPGQLLIQNAPPDTTYGLPFTRGTQWGSTFATTTVITIAAIEFSRTVRNYILSYVVDAYGPMKMPGGSIHQALRVRKEDRSGNTIVSYSFIAKDGATVQVTAFDPLSPDSGTITVARKYVSWTGGPPVSVQNSHAVPGEYSLLQNYPNPFNPTTEIGYNVPATGYVTLKVYDLLGREVATLVNEQKVPGSYSAKFDASGLGSGVYLYRLRAGDFVATKRLVLLK
jgi:hypothetical protein